jgi:Protein of unknown function (DUF2950)
MLDLMEKRSRVLCPGSVVAALLVLIVAVSVASCSKRENKNAEGSAGSPESATGKVSQKTFASPSAAGAALFEAAKSGDRNELVAIFGPDSKDLVSSGDAVKDKDTMKVFVDAYSQMNRWSKNQAGSETLYIGADNFPFPIPLEQNSSGQWVFNTAAGKDEVLARRIGNGELTAIGVLTEVANAQQEYFGQNHQFAQKFVSSEGQHDGLYWPVSENQPPSPLGHLGDLAKALGYSQSDKPQPFNGYNYKILTKQGAAAKGGAKDYSEGGKMTSGFAVVAWPAKYGNSGVMTFIVGKDGVVYEKNLGEKTGDEAAEIAAYDPGQGWKVVLAPEQPNVSTVQKTASE